MGSIYKITNTINNKVYIGQTKNDPRRRWTEHKRDAKKEDYDFVLYRSIRKYGVENFIMEVIEENVEVEYLNEREMYWIAQYDSLVDNGKGYNMTSGGGQDTYISQATREKHRINALTGVTGHRHLPRELVYTEEVRKKMSDRRKGWRPTKEQRERMSKAQKGRIVSAETREKLREVNIGRKHTEETKQKLSQQKKEFLSNKENHNFYGKFGAESSRHSTIYQYDVDWELVQVFGCQLEALDYLGLKGHSGMNKAIKEKTLYKGYYWSKEAVETIETT